MSETMTGSGTALHARAAHLLTAANRIIVANAGSMVGTTGITAILGYAYWALAARQFPPSVVGFAAAAVTAMTLLGTIGMLGLGTLLIGQLPRRPGVERQFIVTALVAAGLAGTILGGIFAGVVGLIAPDLAPLGADSWNVVLFALGVGLTSVALVLDQALIGLLRGEAQLARNVVFAVAKLAALAALAAFAYEASGFDIYLTWAAGILLSLACMVALVPARGGGWRSLTPRWHLLHGLGGAAAGHHALNLALHAPPLALPLVVVATLSATINAYFYTAWMVAAFVFVGPFALTTALYASGARDPSALRQRMRLTLGLATAIGIVANLGVLVGAGPVLSLFGAGYAEHARVSLHILTLEVFPLIVKDHYVTIARLEGRIASASAVVAGFGVMRLGAAAAGAMLGGLEGLAIGWVVAACVEAVCAARPVLRVGFSRTETGPVAPAEVAGEIREHGRVSEEAGLHLPPARARVGRA